MEQLIRYINSYAPLNEAAVDALKKLVVVEEYSKNDFILQPGQRCNKIWYLNKGMVRKFHLHDGNDITIWIHTENEFITSLQSYAQNLPSEEYLQACEDTLLIGLTRESSAKLSVFQQFVTFSNKLMEQQFVQIDRHTREFNQRDARGKYEFLREIVPEVVKRAKLGHIASMIGITRETLSRIRNQV